jgi:hypothetical protein
VPSSSCEPELQRVNPTVRKEVRSLGTFLSTLSHGGSVIISISRSLDSHELLRTPGNDLNA